ncbi:hypothetical protein E2C01_018635 [Portunus trituberculatus]|uniref:Uncharacterized protein n=1 Tax=Portunus trituberculatus TaxID=210409 RepID=A0A5B7DWP6_PORTR|nr:hypothetical protein [Portunus trituberculatus]
MKLSPGGAASVLRRRASLDPLSLDSKTAGESLGAAEWRASSTCRAAVAAAAAAPVFSLCSSGYKTLTRQRARCCASRGKRVPRPCPAPMQARAAMQARSPVHKEVQGACVLEGTTNFISTRQTHRHFRTRRQASSQAGNMQEYMIGHVHDYFRSGWRATGRVGGHIDEDG